MATRSVYLLIFALLFSSPLMAANLAIAPSAMSETLTITAPGIKLQRAFTMHDPERLIVEISKLPERPALILPGSYHGKLIRGVRVGWFNTDTIRIVFELKRAVNVFSTTQGKGMLRLTIGTGTPPVKKSAAPKPAARLKTEQKAAPQAQAPQQEEAPKPENAIPLIAIDAGHGGQDPGATGPGGTHEKDVVLQFARDLRAQLLKTGKYRVVLTRDSDIFIFLRERVAIARKAGADLFVSLHADSAPESMEARGLSIYTLSEDASDKESAALAAKENKADVLSGMDLSNQQEDVAGILISLAQRDTKSQSAHLADTLVKALAQAVKLLPNSHRFAGFAVLKAPDIPSVLVETGFISNPDEEKLLKSPGYRGAMTKALADGIDRYFAQKRGGR